MGLSRLDVRFFKMAVGMDKIGKETDVDISARCPICSTDKRWERTKRLHIYNKGSVTNINCFTGDCAVKNRTVYSFLRDFFPTLLGQYKRENFGNTMESLASGNGDAFGQFKKQEKPRETVEKENPKEVTTHDLTAFFKDIDDVPEALEYLKSRGLQYNEELYGKWYFGHQDLKIGDVLYKITNAIIIPIYYEGIMYGFYSRNIYDKTFYTYNPEVNIGYKVWNWFNIDKTQPVHIFEAIFDAIASGLPNVIACMGAKLPDDRLKQLEQPVFVLDNDVTGFNNSIEYARLGHDVFIQPHKYPEKDMNDLLQNNEELDIPALVRDNLFTGISAEVRLKNKL